MNSDDFRLVIDGTGKGLEYGLYMTHSGRNRRVCGVYIHPEKGYTGLVWWTRRATEALPDRVEFTDVGLLKLMLPALAASEGDFV